MAVDNGRMGNGSPRLRDVADAAGVSVATASKALNGRQDVSAATRDKVLQASRLLSFRPNRAAQQLQGGASGTVGLIASDLDGRFSIPIMMGAEDGFGIENVSVFLTDARGDLIRERHHLEALMARGVDGFIFVGSRTDPRPPIAMDVPVPVVHVYAPSEDPESLSFVPDNVDAGRRAARHLLDLGRTRIALIAGDPSYVAYTDRLAGIGEVLGEAGVQLVSPGALRRVV
jgi:LacI family transcriptional regulator